MRTYRCFVDIPQLTAPDRVTLASPASHHLINVLKIKVGNPLTLFNGTDKIFMANVHQITRHHVIVDVKEVYEESRESPLHIHLVQAITKGERMDFTLQKSVELGVAEITPVFSERCEVRLKGERVEVKMNHWRKVIISACEQCGRNRLPVLNTPEPFMEWIRNHPTSLGLIADPRATQTLHELTLPSRVVLMIGPEGGFSLSEVDWAIQHEFKPIRVGPRILRTETAAMAIITALQCKAGDL